jgi:hypothetical protein
VRAAPAIGEDGEELLRIDRASFHFDSPLILGPPTN